MTAEEARAAAIPVFEEELRVDKTVSEIDRVLIRTSVLERTEYIDLELRSGEATMNESASIVSSTLPRQIRQEGDTIIVPVLEEIMVFEKLLLKEEIHIRRQEVVQHLPQPVRLRSEEVSLERQPFRSPTTSNRKTTE